MPIQFKKIKKMKITPIKTEIDYREALKRFELLFDATIGTAEGDDAEILALLIDEYENTHYPIEAPDPIESYKNKNGRNASKTD